MRAAIAIGAVVLGAIGPADAGPGGRPAAAREVESAEHAWSRAFLGHDLAALSKLLADDFVGVDGRGVVSDKAAELEKARVRTAALSS